jgi:FkbM family methyltransferase
VNFYTTQLYYLDANFLEITSKNTTNAVKKMPYINYLLSKMNLKNVLYCKILKCKTKIIPRFTSGIFHQNSYSIRYTDILSLYVEYKDIFVNRIYHFETDNLTPYIIDGGGCIGMSVMYFKSVYPNAKIVCFEPDEDIFKILHSNISANHLRDVDLVKAGLACEQGTISFQSDGSDGGKISNNRESNITTINTVRLSDYLTKPVDFLKLNIEGQELPVLQEAVSSGKLYNVRELVLEYHNWPGEEQRLGKILELLTSQGFHYLIHDFDAETCGTTKPPFHLTTNTTWFCLVYARKFK